MICLEVSTAKVTLWNRKWTVSHESSCLLYQLWGNSLATSCQGRVVNKYSEKQVPLVTLGWVAKSRFTALSGLFGKCENNPLYGHQTNKEIHPQRSVPVIFLWSLCFCLKKPCRTTCLYSLVYCVAALIFHWVLRLLEPFTSPCRWAHDSYNVCTFPTKHTGQNTAWNHFSMMQSAMYFWSNYCFYNPNII